MFRIPLPKLIKKLNSEKLTDKELAYEVANYCYQNNYLFISCDADTNIDSEIEVAKKEGYKGVVVETLN